MTGSWKFRPPIGSTVTPTAAPGQGPPMPGRWQATGGLPGKCEGAPLSAQPCMWFLPQGQRYSSRRPCLGEWGVMGQTCHQAGVSSSGDRHGVGSSCTWHPTPPDRDNAGCVQALQGEQAAFCVTARKQAT